MSKKIIDLFAGAGGLTYGFWKNKYEICETVEFWQPAVNTYNKNYNKNVLVSDITDEKIRNDIEKKWKNKIDIIIGGFPCQGFSLAGKRDVNDPRNQLYNYTIDIINKVNPKLFCLENVKGILSYKEKDGIKVIDKIIQKLSEIGYYSRYVLLDSSNFSVPQKRERVIFIGSKKNQKKNVDKIIQKLENYKSKLTTVRDAIEDLEEMVENKDFNHIFTNHSIQMIEKIKNTKPGFSVMKNFSDAFRRLDYDKPSYTVKENHGGVHIHPKFNRVLTPRELARLQSFPDEFIFCGNKSEILKQIGNAVPCKLSIEISNIINDVLKW